MYCWIISSFKKPKKKEREFGVRWQLNILLPLIDPARHDSVETVRTLDLGDELGPTCTLICIAKSGQGEYVATLRVDELIEKADGSSGAASSASDIVPTEPVGRSICVRFWENVISQGDSFKRIRDGSTFIRKWSLKEHGWFYKNHSRDTFHLIRDNAMPGCTSSWEELNNFLKKFWTPAEPATRREMAPMVYA
ncbi:hypothetical protein C5167_011901 [Papaver somniferum]|uniref:Uncharacterized protein n=1 Tax=Papaver somniferum TaxID=3469 RepID=A0A4Y7IZ30_PAPSO|nr:hypothetical protein C5167_011901 [Papaver somniferum]